MRKLLLLNFICAFQALTIFAQAPAITYSSPSTFITGTAVTPLSPTNTGGAVPAVAYGQVSTFAGSGSAFDLNPSSITIDVAGNLYVSETRKVKKISPTGVITFLAGSGAIGDVDGEGTAASFNYISGIAVDANLNVYVADAGNKKIRKISTTGVVSTFAGSGVTGSVDGIGSLASFSNPQGIALDASGNLYVADRSNNRIRKISPAGVVSTFAGSGSATNVDATGTSASFNSPNKIAVDMSGNLYVVGSTDIFTDNNKIRKISPAGVVSTLAGNNLNSSRDGLGTLASFYLPESVTVDKLGNVYVSETFGRIRKISPTGMVSTLAGSGKTGSANGIGSAASFNSLAGLTIDAMGNLFAADRDNSLIRKIITTGYTVSPALPTGLGFDLSTGIISGTPTEVSPTTTYMITAYNADGTNTVNLNFSTIIPSVAPSITSFTPSTGGEGTVVTITGDNLLGATTVTIGNIVSKFTSVSASRIVAMISHGAQSGDIRVTNPYGSATSSGFTALPPPLITYESPQAYTIGNTISPLAPVNSGSIVPSVSYGQSSTLAGTGTAGSSDGTGTAAAFSQPNGVAADAAGNLYIADYNNQKIRKITSTGVVTTFAGNGSFGTTDGNGVAANISYPSGITIDLAGNLYVVNSGIRKVTPSGDVSTLVTGVFNSVNNVWRASNSQATGVAVDAGGYIYVADWGDNLIRKISPSGVVSVFAGNGATGSTDGIGTSATFDHPCGLAVDITGNLYVADQLNNKIRKITPFGVVSTIAGNGSRNSIDGIGISASFSLPTGITVDAGGNIYVSQTGYHSIRKISPQGVVSTLAGTGYQGSVNAIGTSASFNYPSALALDGLGNLCVADEFNHLIRKIALTGYSVSPTLPSGLTFDNTTGIISGTPTTISAPTTYTVNTSNLNGSASTTLALSTVIPAVAPSIASFSPTASKPGSYIIITGSNLLGATKVIIGGVEASSYNIISSTSISALVPTGVISGDITVTNPYGTASLSGFTCSSPIISYTSLPIYHTAAAITPLPPQNTGGLVPTLAYSEVSTVAGNIIPGAIDNTGTAASFNLPWGVVVDASGNLFVTDQANHKIRKITPEGVVTTFAGSGIAGSVDAVGTSASFNTPKGIGIDASDNLYVADFNNHKIRKITPAGVVSTVAGNGTIGSVNGLGTSARFKNPVGLALDASGNIYVGDEGNNLIRIITPGGSVSTLAGSGSAGFANGIGTSASFSRPNGVAVDASGNVYVADFVNSRIRKITPGGIVSTLAGNGVPSLSSIDGVGTAAGFINPTGVTTDPDGNVYVAEYNSNKIRKITPTGVVTTLAGTGLGGSTSGIGTVARFNRPTSLVLDGKGNLYVADQINNMVRKVIVTGYSVNPALPAGLTIDNATGIISGSPTSISSPTTYTITAHNVSGTDTATITFSTPIPAAAPVISSLTPSSAGIEDFVRITGNNLLGATSVTIAGVPALSFNSNSPTTLDIAIPPNATSGSITVTNPYGSATIEGFTFIPAPAISYAGPQTYGIGKPITPLAPNNTGGAPFFYFNWQVSTLAGTTLVAGSTNATGTAAKFNFPAAVTTDALGNIYVADQFNNKIRKITPSGVVTTFAGSGTAGSVDGTGTVAGFNKPTGIAIDGDGNLYVADKTNHKIRKISPDGLVSTLAGSGFAGFADGNGTQAAFNNPASVTVDTNGNVFVADASNNAIRKISPTGIVSTLAGNGSPGSANGMGSAASFNLPLGISIDKLGNLYVADSQNNKVRKITTDGLVSTLAGTGSLGSAVGAGNVATFQNPISIAVDSIGNVYVGNANNYIRKIRPNGTVSSFAGIPSAGSDNGLSVIARFNQPTGLAFDGLGNFYIADQNNHLIRKMLLSGYTIQPAMPAGLNFDISTGIISGTPLKSSSATTYTIVVYNTSGSDTTTVTIATDFAPAISSFSPATAVSGTTVTLTGTSFTGATSVSFGGTPAASYQIVSPTSITAVVGSGYSGDVSVTTTFGSATLTGFHLVPLPTVSAGSATTFIMGGNVVLSASPGSGYSYQWLKNGVNINGAIDSTYAATESGAFSVRITLNSVSQVSDATTVNVLPVPVPTITSISPSTAVSGTTVTLTGTNFTGATAVSFGGTAAASFSVISPTNITAVVGSGSSGETSVTTGYGTSTLAGFNFVPVPSTTAGGVTTFILGGNVVLTASPGSGFTYQWLKNGVDISGANTATYTATQSGAYTVRITLNSVSQVSTSTTVNVLPIPVPTITSISPSTAVTGTTVTFTGTNFTGATAVNFGGTAATSFNVVSPTTITAVVGSGTSGNVSVTTGYGTATLSGFNFVPVPVITAGGITTFISGGNVVLTASPGSGFSYQWLKNGVNISGATNATYTATESGAFSVRISLNSVSQASNIITVNTIFGLPATNFKLIANSATCNGLNNGSIKIKATQKLNYSASISGNSIPFTDSLKIDNLLPGTYNVCITVAGQPDYQQCYTAVITQPKELSVYTAVSNSGDQVVLSLSGSDWYKINLNGTNYITSDNQITLPLTKGTNTISVSSNTACQGVIEKSIRVNYNPVVYPNPFDTILNLSLNNETVKTAGINVYTLDGKLVFSVKNTPIVAGIAQVDLSTLITGEYVLKLITDQSDSIFRIIKR